MKRTLLTLVLTLVLVFALTAAVSADILWEPYNNDYYDYEACETVAKTYAVPEGMTVNVYTAPEGGTLLTTLEAGTRVYVGFRQEVNGEIWGVGYPYGDYNTEGWFRLGRLQREYDHELFMEEHEVSNEGGAITDYQVQDQIYTWTYPGSGLADGAIDAISPDYNDGRLTYQFVYTDPDGGQWGYVGYYMGRCGWIYLDDPENPNPPLFPLEAESTVTDTSPTEEAPGAGQGLVWVIALVAVVVAVTGVLIAVLKKKKRSGTSQ